MWGLKNPNLSKLWFYFEFLNLRSIMLGLCLRVDFWVIVVSLGCSLTPRSIGRSWNSLSCVWKILGNMRVHFYCYECLAFERHIQHSNGNDLAFKCSLRSIRMDRNRNIAILPWCSNASKEHSNSNYLMPNVWIPHSSIRTPGQFLDYMAYSFRKLKYFDKLVWIPWAYS